MADNPVRVQRIYEPLAVDGVRILVDRIWPRGFRKDDARIDLWLKNAAPSRELREWYKHDPARFAEFRRRYLIELGEPDRRSALEQLRDLRRQVSVTLVTATRDVAHSHAAVLAEILDAER